MMNAQEELERFIDRKSTIFGNAMIRLAHARMEDAGTSRHTSALRDLAELIRRTMILSDLHGRKRMLMEYDAAKNRRGKFEAGSETTPIVPGVPFEEAIENLITRDPRLAQSALEVSRLYSTEHVFAMAKSCEMELTKKVQKVVTDLLLRGEDAARTENLIMEIGNWTRAYAATVYRTNASTAYSNGRFTQAKDPDVAEVIPAMEFVAQDDARVRPNHVAAHGLIAPTNDAIWAMFKPPLGYNCRCAALFVSVFDLERRGLVQNGRAIRYTPPGFEGAFPDPGFKVGGLDFQIAA